MSRGLPHAGAVSVLEEPLLEFRYGQRLPDPRDGLSIFGPCDSDEPSHPKSMTYAVIGPSEGVAAFEEWSRAMQRPAEAPRPDVPFHTALAVSARRRHARADWRVPSVEGPG